MTMQFSHAVGYRGIAKVSDTTLLCTGGNINLTQDPIMSGGVWGAGYKNAAPIAYAFNYLSLEGSANFEWVAGIWNKMKSFAFTDRTAETEITLFPDGKNGFKGNGWCSSLSFEASEAAALTGSFNFKGDPSGDNIHSTGEGDTTPQGASQGKPYASGLVGDVLIPYWQTCVYRGVPTINESGTTVAWDSNPLKDIINWSCSYNSDLQVLKCCNYQSEAPIGPDYILCGEMSGEGSYTIFKIQDDFDPASYHSTKSLKFQIGDSHSVEIKQVLVNSGSTAMATGASYISCDFSFTALGNGVDSIIEMN